MNYKITTYVLLVVLAGFIIYACQQPKDQALTAETQLPAEAQPDCPCQTIFPKSEKAVAGIITRTSGALIPSGDARELLRQFKQDFTIKCDDPDTKYIHGFSFGVEKFLEFSDAVRRLDGPSKNLLGVRVYYARKKRTPGPNMPDVFLIPIGPDGRSIYDIDECTIPQKANEVRTGDVILNTSIPCPNQCQ